MKNIALQFLFILLPLLTVAQEVTFDTTYLSTPVNGKYFVIQRVEDENMEYDEKGRVIGDSTTTASFLKTKAINESQELAKAAMKVIRSREVKKRYDTINGLFKQLTGIDLYRQTNRDYFVNFEGSWIISYNGADTKLTTELQANGNARFKDAQNATWQFRVYSPYQIQLRSWDGQNWDLFSEDGKLFLDLTKTVRLKKQ